jgi:hypothetical protein
VRRHRPAVIWTTFPIPTAHRIGYWLQRLMGLPWVADFRDSMTEEERGHQDRVTAARRDSVGLDVRDL